MTEPGTLPRTVGSYTLLEVVGRGPRGTVYRARKDGRRLAVKIVDDGVRLDLDTLGRFLRGTDDQIRHPNIAVLEGLGVADGMRFYATRVLAGDPLVAVLRDLRQRSSDRPFLSPLSVTASGELHPSYLTHAIELLIPVARGLEHAYEQGVCHGRISPGNLIFSPGGHLVLTDFGGDARGESLGSLPYCAPEQLLDDAELDVARCDVHALGAILYEFATLCVPWHDDDGKAAADDDVLRRRILAAKLPRPRSLREDISTSLEECILLAMAPDPESRYSSAGRLAEDLERFLNGKPTFASRSAKPQRIGSDASQDSRWRVVVRAAVAAILLVLAGLAFHYGRAAHELGSWNDIREDVLTTFNRGDRTDALAKISELEDRSIDDPRPKRLRRQLSTEAARSHLVLATKAMVSRKVRAARREILSASRFEPDAETLVSLRREVENLAHIDPVVRDLSDPRWSVRLGALERLREQLATSRRPAADTALAGASLSGEHASERELAYSIFEAKRNSTSLLDALAIGNEHPPRRLDLGRFARLIESLDRIDDKAADDVRSRWSLAAMRRLDSLDTGSSIVLRPNLIVEGNAFDGRAPRSRIFFLRRWLATATRLDPDSVTENALEIATEDTLVTELIESLWSIGTSSAISALEALARERHEIAGCSAIDALARLDASTALRDLLASDLPVIPRAAALESLGISFLGESAVRDQLLRVLRQSPVEDLRTLAFHHLGQLDGADGWDPRPALLAGLFEPELQDDALAWFARIHAEWKPSLAMDLLHDPRQSVRESAVSALSSDRDIGRFLTLVLCLSDRQSTTRRAALRALVARNDLENLARHVSKHTIEPWSRMVLRLGQRFLERPVESHGPVPPGDVEHVLERLLDRFRPRSP